MRKSVIKVTFDFSHMSREQQIEFFGSLAEQERQQSQKGKREGGL